MRKNILGLYVDRESLHYLSVVKGLSGYRLKNPGLGYGAFGKKQGNGFALLKGVLKEISPDRSREIYLALPRSMIFARTIDLPAMPLEDALLSIKSSIGIYSHLEPGTFYYDIHVSQCTGEGVKTILFYASKTDIDKFQKIFSDTGHGGALKGIFPVSYGLVPLAAGKETAQAHTGFRLDGDDISEVCVCRENKLVLTMTAPLHEDEVAVLQQSVISRFSGLETHFFDITADHDSGFGNNVPKRLSFLPSVHENMAVGAVAPSLSKIQQISVDDQPVRIKFVHPIRYILPFICLLVLALYSMTNRIDADVQKAEKEFNELKTRVVQLENRLDPLKKKIETLKKAASFKEDVKKIIKTKPRLYSVINEIAVLIPEGTWFPGFSYHDGKVVLRGRGDDALKTVELLRSSDLFGNVSLKGSVNRAASGDERFTIALELKRYGDEQEK